MMLVRGAEPMEKRQRRVLFFIGSVRLNAVYYPELCEQITPAAVSRQERSDRVSEEASFNLH